MQWAAVQDGQTETLATEPANDTVESTRIEPFLGENRVILD